MPGSIGEHSPVPVNLGRRITVIQHYDTFIPLSCRDFTGAGDLTVEALLQRGEQEVLIRSFVTFLCRPELFCINLFIKLRKTTIVIVPSLYVQISPKKTQ